MAGAVTLQMGVIAINVLALSNDLTRKLLIFARKSVADIHNLSIKSKFLQLGYETYDVKNVRWERECQQSAPLTDRSKLQ